MKKNKENNIEINTENNTESSKEQTNIKEVSLFKSPFLKDVFRGYKRYLLAGGISVVLAAAAAYTIPIIINAFIDFILMGDSSKLPSFVIGIINIVDRDYILQNLWIVMLAVVITAFISGLFTYLRMRFAAEISEGVARNLRNKLYSHLQNVPYDYYKHVSAGDIVQRCSSDVDTIRRFVSVQLLEIIRALSNVSVALVVMISIDVRMAVISTCALPLLFAFTYVFFNKIKSYFLLSDEAEGRISTVVQENLSGMRVVRAFGQQKNEVEKFEQTNSEYRKVTVKLIDLLGYFWGSTDLLSYALVGVTLIFSIVFTIRGELSVGNIFAFTMFVGMMAWPVRQMGRILADYGKSTVALGRLEEVINVKQETEPGKALKPEIKGNIVFEDVTFGYDYPNEVLDGINLKVKAGQTVAILGSTGSGKSSLVHLLQRLYECTGGRIMLDGVDVNDIERHHLRKQIGIVLQEPFLYSRSIFENIRIANPEASEEEVYAVSEIASIHDVIQAFENGYDTMVGERGVTLSGGQKQRVAIARMLMQNAPILVFDDSLSAVDTETDATIRAALAKRRRNSTTFLISHRVTTLSESDFIIVLENGRIVQKGTHEELLREEGLYKRIAGIQTRFQMDETGGGE